MTPRPLARTRQAALLTVGLLALLGCNPMQALYFLQPWDPQVAAPCPSLKGKRVVVLTYAAPGTQNDFTALDREVNTRLVKILRENVKKIDVVNPEKVAAWVQAHPSSTDQDDAAKAFEADVAIMMEIRKFEVDNPSSPGLFEGKASVHIRVTELAHPKDSRGRPLEDKPKESEVLFEDDCEVTFPVTGSIPVSAEVSRPVFKNRFLDVVATNLSWRFVSHAPGDDIQDTKFR